MSIRVVITGLGVVSPNGIGVGAFKKAIKKGISGIRFLPKLCELKFHGQVGGIPEITESQKKKYMSDLELRKFKSKGVLYGMIAGLDAWADAQLKPSPQENPYWDSGAVIGIGSTASEKLREGMLQVDNLKTKRLGSNFITQTMPSGIGAYLGGKLGLGNQVTTNSSACSTGTESILMAYERLKQGKAQRMLAGGINDGGPYAWAGFDAMRVTAYKHNDEPEKASRPMAIDASGFVPGSGAGVMVLETLESARDRGVHIYGEILGGSINSGGQRDGGSMTLPNGKGVQRCIKDALKDAGIHPDEIDVINGHLTSTGKCPLELKNWAAALNRQGKNFPYITALKSMIGHALGAAGAIESVAAILQLDEGFLIPNLNCETPDPEIAALIDEDKITKQYEKKNINIIAKSGFGFGDVNACLILKKFID